MLELNDLRRVTWYLEDDQARPSKQDQLVPRDDVELLVQAVLRLHHDPGVNPHNGRKAATLVRLTVGTPELGAGYWWTAPTLEDDGPRARVVVWHEELRFQREAVDEPDPPE